MCPSCFLLAFSPLGWAGAPPVCVFCLVGGGGACPEAAPCSLRSRAGAPAPLNLLFDLLAFAPCRQQELRYGHATRCGRSVSGTVRCGSAVAGGSVAFSGRGSASGSGAAACNVSLAPFPTPPLRCARAPCAPCSLASSLTAPETLPSLAPNCALRSDPAIYMLSMPTLPAPLATLAPHPCPPARVCVNLMKLNLLCSGLGL